MNNGLALIVAPPGDLQDGLVALVTTLPQIQAVLMAEEADSALRLIATHRPKLLLLEMDLVGNQAATILQAIKSHWPDIQSIVFTDSAQQKLAAESLDADAVLFTGFRATELIDTIDTQI